MIADYGKKGHRKWIEDARFGWLCDFMYIFHMCNHMLCANRFAISVSVSVSVVRFFFVGIKVLFFTLLTPLTHDGNNLFG